MTKSIAKIDLPTFEDERGKLTVVEENDNVPFDIKRVFYIYDVPATATRGEHAHAETEQLFIAVSGTVELTADCGGDAETFVLDEATTGLYTPTLTWVDMTDFSDDAVLVVFASTQYDPAEYIQDRNEFDSIVKNRE